MREESKDIIKIGLEEAESNMKAGAEVAAVLAQTFDPLLDVAKEIASREIRRAARTIFSRH